MTILLLEEEVSPSRFNTMLVRDLVVRDQRVRLALEKIGIDTCCGGGRKLKTAAAELGVSREQLQAAVDDALEEQDMPRAINWNEESTGQLIEHLVIFHHGWLHDKLPKLDFAFKRVMQTHKLEHGVELHAFQNIFNRLYAELVPHMKIEEDILFPAMLAGKTLSKEFVERCGALEAEHHVLGRQLHKIAQVTRHYRVPCYACNAVENLFRNLEELDQKLHEHMYLENNILFPRIQEPELCACSERQ